MRFLVRVPNWIGDALLAQPALESLRLSHPGSEIWLLARDWVKDLYPPKTLAAGIVPLSGEDSPRGLLRAARTLKPLHFDAGLLLTNSFASALLFRLAGIPERWGYRRDGRSFLLTRGVPFKAEGPARHQLDWALSPRLRKCA